MQPAASSRTVDLFEASSSALRKHGVNGTAIEFAAEDEVAARLFLRQFLPDDVAERVILRCIDGAPDES